MDLHTVITERLLELGPGDIRASIGVCLQVVLDLIDVPVRVGSGNDGEPCLIRLTLLDRLTVDNATVRTGCGGVT